MAVAKEMTALLCLMVEVRDRMEMSVSLALNDCLAIMIEGKYHCLS